MTAPSLNPGNFEMKLVQNSDYRRRLSNITDQDGNIIDLSTVTVSGTVFSKFGTEGETILTPTYTPVSPAATSGAVDIFIDHADLADLTSYISGDRWKTAIDFYQIGFFRMLFSESAGDQYYYIVGNVTYKPSEGV